MNKLRLVITLSSFLALSACIQSDDEDCSITAQDRNATSAGLLDKVAEAGKGV
ncbi:MAG: hypothetical protein KZQ76_14205 [Candidatus Thiodiazotropha sp. (ex Epidulcina cf. delphinae)]|nr:hypothetical protein [Candidatus Thiodiazotropha sp. (ex Epidulcina cf. delphinae)]